MMTNMGSSSDIGDYVADVRASGADVAEVSVIPLSGQLPEIEYDGPVVVYGAVSFVTAAEIDGRWCPGVFADPSVFTYENWAKHYNEMLLNSPDGTELTTIGAYGDRSGDKDTDVFVRPQHDTKSLVGSVMTTAELTTWCKKVREGGYADLEASTPIVVCKPYAIEAEYRLFDVDGEIVSATQYKDRYKLKKVRGAPDSVLEFGRKAIERWNPVDAYVLDVCISAGNPYIVEAQGFNSAGHYAADIAAVASAVNEVAVRAWKAQKRAGPKP